MPVTTTIRRHAGRSIAVAVLAVVATACPVDPPIDPPTGASGPTAATVTPITPGGSGFGARPMSADARYVGYTRYNPDSFGTDPYLWDRATGSSVALAQPTEAGYNAVAPVVSADGSTVFYSASQPVAGEAPTFNSQLLRVDPASGHLDRFPLPDAGTFPGGKQVWDVASSADGSVAAVDVSDNSVPFFRREVRVWTEAGGFDTITDHDAITSDDVYGYDLPGSAISANGRHVAVATLDRLDATGRRVEHLDVFDRTTRSWTRAWTGDVITRPDISDIVTVLATLDDGSLIFDVTTPGDASTFMQSHGVRLWSSATSTITQLVPGDTAAHGWSASPDGRFVGYTGSDVTGPPSNAAFGTPHLLDRQTGVILPSGSRPITFPVGIGAGAADVLLFSFDPALNTVPAAGNSLFLWHRA